MAQTASSGSVRPLAVASGKTTVPLASSEVKAAILSPDWRAFSPIKQVLPHDIKDVIEQRKAAEMEPFHTRGVKEGDYLKIQIGIPSNWSKLVEKPLFQLMYLVWSQLGYFPVQLDKMGLDIPLNDEQTHVIMGISLWLNNSCTQAFNSDLKGTYKAGYVWAAQKHLNMPQQGNDLLKIEGSSHLAQVLAGNAWVGLNQAILLLFESDLIKALRKLGFNKRNALTWILPDEQVRSKLMRNCPFKDNPLFTEQEQKLLSAQFKKPLEQWTLFSCRDVEVKESLAPIYEAFRVLQKDLKPLKTQCDSCVSHRVKVWLGSSKKEQTRVRKMPPKSRHAELKGQEGYWQSFQPAYCFGYIPFYAPKETAFKNKDEFVKAFSADIKRYLLNVASQGINGLCVQLSESYLQEWVDSY
jgi:hypothetical protein